MSTLSPSWGSSESNTTKQNYAKNHQAPISNGQSFLLSFDVAHQGGELERLLSPCLGSWVDGVVSVSPGEMPGVKMLHTIQLQVKFYFSCRCTCLIAYRTGKSLTFWTRSGFFIGVRKDRAHFTLASRNCHSQ